jgi:hypothetical protein
LYYQACKTNFENIKTVHFGDQVLRRRTAEKATTVEPDNKLLDAGTAETTKRAKDPGRLFRSEERDGVPRWQANNGVIYLPYTEFVASRLGRISDTVTSTGLNFHFHYFCIYSNAETSATATGNGHMEAIYFDSAGGNKGAGNGPWVMADLENGLFSGCNRTANPSNSSMTSRFATAVVKGKPGYWAIRGGNAVSGQLGTFYSGVCPNGGYNPMKKEGAILLGIGGDTSDRGRGTFYEGAITSGYPSDATEDEVQANILAAGHATSS